MMNINKHVGNSKNANALATPLVKPSCAKTCSASHKLSIPRLLLALVCTISLLFGVSGNTQFSFAVPIEPSKPAASVITPTSNPHTQIAPTSPLEQVSISKLYTTKRKLIISWKPVKGASAYELRYRKHKTVSWKIIRLSNTTKTTIKLKKFKRGLNYDFAVRAYEMGASGSEQSSGAWSERRSLVVRPFIVVIDAGHQAHGNSSTEPIGPGSSIRKPKVSDGTSGVASKKSESFVVLKIAKKLEKTLKKEGIKVVMVRRKQNVNIPNSKRAKIANKAGADLFIRLHCDASNSSTHGISTLVPKKNKWTKGFAKSSLQAGRFIQKTVCKKTGAQNRVIYKRGDLSGFNWCKVPTVLVEMGFMTNRSEDLKLNKSSYQNKLAKGMTKGILKYLR